MRDSDYIPNEEARTMLKRGVNPSFDQYRVTRMDMFVDILTDRIFENAVVLTPYVISLLVGASCVDQSQSFRYLIGFDAWRTHLSDVFDKFLSIPEGYADDEDIDAHSSYSILQDLVTRSVVNDARLRHVSVLNPDLDELSWL